MIKIVFVVCIAVFQFTIAIAQIKKDSSINGRWLPCKLVIDCNDTIPPEINLTYQPVVMLCMDDSSAEKVSEEYESPWKADTAINTRILLLTTRGSELRISPIWQIKNSIQKRYAVGILYGNINLHMLPKQKDTFYKNSTGEIYKKQDSLVLSITNGNVCETVYNTKQNDKTSSACLCCNYNPQKVLRDNLLPTEVHLRGSGSKNVVFDVPEKVRELSLSYKFFQLEDEAVLYDDKMNVLFNSGKTRMSTTQQTKINLTKNTKIILQINSSKERSKWNIALSF